MIDALGAKDLTTATIRGLQFGGAIGEGEPTGNELVATEIIAWLSKRHELIPPASGARRPRGRRDQATSPIRVSVTAAQKPSPHATAGAGGSPRCGRCLVGWFRQDDW
jgi:hypothetical protein